MAESPAATRTLVAGAEEHTVRNIAILTSEVNPILVSRCVRPNWKSPITIKPLS